MRIRTADPLLAKQMLYQLSYAPNFLRPFRVRFLGGEPGKFKKLSCALRAI